MFKFTIRELLILTVTAGLAVGWWIDHSAMEMEKERAVLDAIINPPEPCGFSQMYRPSPGVKYTQAELRRLVSDWRQQHMPEPQVKSPSSP
jgi:hypothetical protein